MKDICTTFPITEEEYKELDSRFSKLCYYAAHQLKKKNSRNNYTDDIDDINQELQLSIIRAGSYYKRQVYTESCFEVVRQFSDDKFITKIIDELEDLWENRTRHGANRQKYGKFQEKLLDKIVRKVVPRKFRPRKNEPLKIDSKFATYCKAIIWNGQKSMGKKITREKSIRSGQVSLSEYNYLASEPLLV